MALALWGSRQDGAAVALGNASLFLSSSLDLPQLPGVHSWSNDLLTISQSLLVEGTQGMIPSVKPTKAHKLETMLAYPTVSFGHRIPFCPLPSVSPCVFSKGRQYGWSNTCFLFDPSALILQLVHALPFLLVFLLAPIV